MTEHGLTHAFDAAAAQYDMQFSQLPASKRVRHIMWQIFLKYYRPGMRLIELGCGTGDDAIMLGQKGIHVHATDNSERMIDEVRKKVVAYKLEEFVESSRLAFDELGKLTKNTFNGAYSNFGGLNCAEDLRPIALELSCLLPPGSILILCLMTNFAFWETFSFLTRGRFKDAFRRRRAEGAPANVQGTWVRTFYYSPGKVLQTFAPQFAPIEVGGLNIFTPPPSSARAYEILGRSARVLERLDDLAYKTFPFSCIGDHFYVVLKRD